MQFLESDFHVYEDIKARTSGEMYIGIVGPVRTGKSTFMKRFMEEMVLPNMEDDYEKKLAIDELPQSAGGRTITTTEPKFIPKDAMKIYLTKDLYIKIRLIDCVGFMVEGATGHLENDQDRMVKTPWYEEEIPFTKAAEIGTRKVMQDHATIGIVMISDGSFIGIDRTAYEKAENLVIEELKNLNKPFIILLNSAHPEESETKQLAVELEKKYGITVMAIDCTKLKQKDFCQILNAILYEFPITSVNIRMPDWFCSLEEDHPFKKDMISLFLEKMPYLDRIKDLDQCMSIGSREGIREFHITKVDLATGSCEIMLWPDDKYYYELLSAISGKTITEDYDLQNVLKTLAKMEEKYEKVADAMHQVETKGYGVIMPEKDEIVLEKPEVIRQGNKYGVKIRSESPSIHLIKATIETEIAPIVGTKEQAEDLISYIVKENREEQDIWNTNIFGKTVEQLIRDGMQAKIMMINDESQMKLQETMQKIVNDCNGGMVCIII